MAERIPQSATIRVPLKAYLSSDHASDATGKTLAVTISKNGAAFGNPSAGATNATEIANGWYYVDLSTTDTGTAGPLIVRATGTATDNVETAYNVAALTAAAIATAVWQDATSGDFTVSSSIGKSLYTSGVVPGASGGLFIAGTNAATVVTTSFTTTFTGNLTGSVGSLTGYTTPPTAAAIATAVWQDATAGDFTTSSSIGKSLYNAFGSNTSVFTTAALANGPTGSAPTAAQVATAVWQDSTAGDFTTSNSIGKSLYNAFTAGTSVFTTAALANCPAPASGATAANQLSILSKLNAGPIIVSAPVAADDSIEIVAGDDYADTDGRALQWTVKAYSGPAVAGLTVTFSVMTRDNYDAGTGSYALTQAGTVALTGVSTSFTDLVIDSSNPKKLTSAAHPFDSSYIGQTLSITSGTGFTVQKVKIDSVSGNTATCSSSLGTLGSTSGVGAMVQDALFKVELTAAQTGALSTSPPDDKYAYMYQLKATTNSGSRIITQVLSSMNVKRKAN